MTYRLISMLLASAFCTAVLQAQVPGLLNYQGRVAVGTVNFDGSGSFKFALVNAAGDTTYWSNDGTSTTGSEPTAAVSLTVTKGLYSVLLGDTALANMTAVPATVFNNTDVRLRVWFNDGTNGSQLLTPDQRIAAVGYAVMAGNVQDGAITSAKIAAGAVGTPQLANGAIGTAQIAPGTVLPAVSIAGTMQAATANTSYLATNAGQTTIGLTDTTANAGDVVTVTGVGAGGWIASLYQPDIWTARESNRDWLSVASSADGNKLVAVEYGGQIYTSTDFGVSWTARESNRNWYSVASSADGSKLVAVVYQGQIYTSTDSGVNWTARESNRYWGSVASSADGSKLVAVVNGPGGGQIYTSTDFGVSWTARESTRSWRSVASSADGSKLVAGVSGGQIYTSANSGVSWTPRESSRTWVAVASSADGNKLVAVDNYGTGSGGQIYTSTDSGVSWTPRESNRFWRSVASSADGSKLVAGVNGGQIYTSTDSGVSWTPRESSRAWVAIASSADGNKLVAGAYTDKIYTSGATVASGAQGTTATLQYLGSGQWMTVGGADGTVGASQLASNAVQSANIAAGAVGSTQLGAGAVQSGNIAAGAVGNTQLGANAVQSANIAAGAVGSSQIATSAVGTQQMADGAVTIPKFSPGYLSNNTDVFAAGQPYRSDQIGTVTYSTTFGVPFAAGTIPQITLPAGWTLDAAATETGFSATATFESVLVDNGDYNPPSAKHQVGVFSSLAMIDGRPAIAYRDNTSLDLKYIIATDPLATAWSAPVTVDAVGNAGNNVSMVVIGGKPAISYCVSGTPNELKFAIATDASGSSWTITTVLTHADAFSKTSLALVNGFPAIATTLGNNIDTTKVLAYAVASNADGSGAWNVVTVDSATDAGSQYVSLAVVAGNPAISYVDNAASELRYIRANDPLGAAWPAGPNLNVAVKNAIPVAATGATSMAIIDGHPAIAFRADITSSGDTAYVRALDPDGATWGPVKTVITAGQSNFVSLAVVAGRPAISSNLTASSYGVRFAVATDSTGATWRDMQVVGTPSGALYTRDISMIDLNGRVAVAYSIFGGNLWFMQLPDFPDWSASSGEVYPFLAARSASVTDGAITSSSIASGAVGNTQLGANAVQSANIASGAVGGSQLSAGAAVVNLSASGQSGVASGGLLLSATENVALQQAGYVRIGTTQLSDNWIERTQGAAPTARSGHTAFWTGSEMIVWGGGGLNDGGRYNPAANSWTATSTTGAPAARGNHTAVWTGSEMIVWGGYGGSYLNDGGRYNPVADTWTATSTTGAPAARYGHTSVWTGSEMIVWGGNGGSFLNDGGRYNPAANTWTAVSGTGAPAARGYHTAVWTGSEMIVWGGNGGTYSYFNDGGRYDPAANSWTATNTTGAPAARDSHTAVWTGSEMIVWGGSYYDGSDHYLTSGGRYDSAADTWTAVSTTGAPSAREWHTAVWTGSEMIVWGGWGGSYLNDGGRYNPSANTWTAVSSTGAPSSREYHKAVWTGSEMIVWGGLGGSFLNDGGRYDPAANNWTAVSSTGAPSGRQNHTAVWTGSEMIVWGGGDFDGNFNDGGRYDPAANRWTATSTTGAPAARYGHTAVWTGSEMIVWGGFDGSYLNDGGRYKPATNTWTTTSTTAAPSQRRNPTAVWTGSEMIVWGGFHLDYMNDGGRYDPAADVWRSVSTSSAISGRVGHTAVWTGREMIVWGGSGGLGGITYFNDTWSYTPGKVMFLYQRP